MDLWQHAVVFAAVAGALLHLGRAAWRQLAARRGCAGCDGCRGR